MRASKESSRSGPSPFRVRRSQRWWRPARWQAPRTRREGESVRQAATRRSIGRSYSRALSLKVAALFQSSGALAEMMAALASVASPARQAFTNAGDRDGSGEPVGQPTLDGRLDDWRVRHPRKGEPPIVNPQLRNLGRAVVGPSSSKALALLRRRVSCLICIFRGLNGDFYFVSALSSRQ
jgi:hypothetical protein